MEQFARKVLPFTMLAGVALAPDTSAQTHISDRTTQVTEFSQVEAQGFIGAIADTCNLVIDSPSVSLNVGRGHGPKTVSGRVGDGVLTAGCSCFWSDVNDNAYCEATSPDGWVTAGVNMYGGRTYLRSGSIGETTQLDGYESFSHEDFESHEIRNLLSTIKKRARRRQRQLARGVK